MELLDDDATFKFFGCYLADGDLDDEAGGDIGMSNFRIVCRLYRDGHSLAAVFSTSGGSSGGGMGSWTLTEKERHVVPGPRADLVKNLGTAGGSWYFLNVQGRRLITFDGTTGEFSSMALYRQSRVGISMHSPTTPKYTSSLTVATASHASAP